MLAIIQETPEIPRVLSIEIDCGTCRVGHNVEKLLMPRSFAHSRHSTMLRGKYK